MYIKLSVILFMINLLVLLIAYNVYLISFHYSDDTFVALSPHNLAEVNLGNGRIIHYLLYSALDILGFALPKHMVGLRSTENRTSSILRFHDYSALLSELYFLVFFLPLIASLGLLIICSASPLAGAHGFEP